MSMKVQIIVKDPGSDRPPLPFVEVSDVSVSDHWVKVVSLVPLGLGGPWERRTTWTNRDIVDTVYLTEDYPSNPGLSGRV